MFTRKTACLLLFIWVIWAGKLLWQHYGRLHELKVVFCDVGQGDSILIADGQHQILIDGGPDAAVLSCLQRELPTFDRQLELVILSHPDSDHFAGLTAVLDHYRVKRLMINNMAKASADFWQFYQAVWRQREKGLQVIVPALGMTACETAEICWQVVSQFEEILPENLYQNRKDIMSLSTMLTEFVQSSYNYNDWSIGIKFRIDDKMFLFTGDAEQKGELAMIEGGLLSKIDVLKAGHHGSKSSSSPGFLQILQPETSVISCGRQNSYGHPHAQTLANLQAVGSAVLRTDQLGWIKYERRADGGWQWQTERSPD